MTELHKANKVELSTEDQQYLSMLPDQMGLQDFSLRDLNISMLRIIENNSPQKKRNKPQYMPEAEEGDILDIALGTLHKDFFFLPLKHVKRWVEWIPRERGGGFVANHKVPIQTDEEFKLPNGNELTETSYFLGWMLHMDGSKTFCIIPMEKTRLRDARNFNTLITSEKDAKGNRIPIGFRIFKVSTGPRQRAQHEYYGWDIERTKGTIASWATKNELDLKEVAQEAEEINRTGEMFFEFGKPEEPRQQLGSGAPPNDSSDEADDGKMPF